VAGRPAVVAGGRQPGRLPHPWADRHAGGREALPAVGDFGRFSGTPAIGLVGVFLLITFVGSLGEETGWRGYALPQLQRRFSPLTATLILAPLWFLWHLPQFAIIATYRDFGPAGYVGMFLGLTCGAMVLTWLYNRSGRSISLVIVWHGVYNFVGATQAATGTLAAIVSTLIMVQGIILVVIELRARRRGPPRYWGRHEPPLARRSWRVRSSRSRQGWRAPGRPSSPPKPAGADTGSSQQAQPAPP
jgi:Type II CAAX prenyl endopeptidase Rce1-like